MTSLLTGVLGKGPAAVSTALIPDLHHFSGRGGKDVIPLWRNREASEPNVVDGLLDQLAATYAIPVGAEDLFAYAYGILASPSYVDRFGEELSEPGPRLPLTKSSGLFGTTTGLGRRLIFLHTYGERFVPKARRRGAYPAAAHGAPRQFPERPIVIPRSFHTTGRRRHSSWARAR